MAVKSSGELSLHNDIAVEFRDDPDHALSEFYGDSPPLPLAGEIAFSDFYGSIRNFDVEFKIIGGGGAGGWGLDDGYSSTSNNPGGDTFIMIDGVEAMQANGGLRVRAAGGVGGKNASRGQPYIGENGFASFYGPGGIANSGDAPATSYGAGGAGAGGDNPSRYDSSGGAGGGGGNSFLFQGTLSVPAGSRVDVIIGAGGTNSGGTFAGGSGASGYAELTVNGGTTNSFTQSGFIILPGV